MYKRILFLLIFPVFLFAQEQPKVGLVLSGGGAKGFAHIGTIREIEKAGIQLDYIGGTSMGAVIAGLYATGYDSYQIEEIIRSADFYSLLRDEVPRREKAFFEKAFLEKHAFTLPLKKGKLTLPLGLSKGQNVLNLLTELFEPVDNITDFSKLPIPFYCIGTDIETGEEIILEKGSMPLAVRASSSFPSLLYPVQINGRLLVDGGVVDNFPVDIMKSKGIDIIIGVNVQGELSNKEKLTSVADILVQIINFQMYAKSNKQLAGLDVYLEPKVKEHTTTSFKKTDEIIEEGFKEAKLFSSVFKEIAKKQKIEKPKSKLVLKPQKFLIDSIIITGNKDYKRNYILGKLKIEKGDSISYQQISKRINALTATNNFERIDYNFEKSNHKGNLHIAVKEEKTQSFLKVGIHYDKLYETGILLNFSRNKVFFSNDEISADLVVGDDIRYDLQYFIDNGFLPSYGFSTRYNEFSLNIPLNITGVNRVNLKLRDFTTRIYTQTTLDKKFALGFGLEHKNLSLRTETILTNNEETLFEKGNYINSFAFLKLDTYNKKTFPTKGFNLDVNAKWYMYSDRNKNLEGLIGGNEFKEFSQIDGSFSGVLGIRKNLVLQGFVDGGFTFGDEETQVFDYTLGGNNENFINNFRSFYGYDVAGLRNQSFLKVRLDVRYEVFKKHYISALANYARVEDNAFDFKSLIGVRKSGYAIGYSLETILGPVELKYAWSPDHNDTFLLFNLGFWF